MSEKTINISKETHKEFMREKYDRGYTSADKFLRDLLDMDEKGEG